MGILAQIIIGLGLIAMGILVFVILKIEMAFEKFKKGWVIL